MISEYGLSIIIPTLGVGGHLPRLLSSIRSQIVDFPIEVIICDNSLDANIHSEIESIFRNYKISVRNLVLSSRGVNHARNQGIFASRFEIILFVDDDCWLEDDRLLQKHFLIHKNKNMLFALGGDYILAPGAKFFDRCYHSIQMKWLHAGRLNKSNNETVYLIGGHFSVKRKIVLENCLSFNEEIAYGGSELSFFNSAYQMGLSMNLENLSVIHETKESYVSVTRKLYLQGRGKAILSRHKNYDSGSEQIISFGNDPSVHFLSVWMENFLALVFWFGFYEKNKNIFGFLKYLFRNAVICFSGFKNRIIKQSNLEIQKKADRGDLL